MSERTRTNERTNERTNVRTNERTNEEKKENESKQSNESNESKEKSNTQAVKSFCCGICTAKGISNQVFSKRCLFFHWRKCHQAVEVTDETLLYHGGQRCPGCKFGFRDLVHHIQRKTCKISSSLIGLNIRAIFESEEGGEICFDGRILSSDGRKCTIEYPDGKTQVEKLHDALKLHFAWLRFHGQDICEDGLRFCDQGIDEGEPSQPLGQGARTGAGGQEPGARSQEPGARSQEPGARSQEPGARS
jgi:hypothetical protein